MRMGVGGGGGKDRGKTTTTSLLWSNRERLGEVRNLGGTAARVYIGGERKDDQLIRDQIRNTMKIFGEKKQTPF